ncbi:EF-hand domain-containing protein [Glaciecola petra]|uniref:EF-hand domain-containing protein n=1 Tax=Glaciecola petra TaxID=3075602 RepID=A0ABU2ZPU7_9ALTE|nr:EF-hand domain-containing protein [Aestuariibacter sp. P117]MDT0594646.1 EF-hand domain-containing protein [Aestuariibacter sp. P117]
MTKTNKIILIGLCVIALQAIGIAAIAQESLMKTLDTDHDGLISLKEAAGHAKLLEQFSIIDVNEDGYISMDELNASEISKG